MRNRSNILIILVLSISSLMAPQANVLARQPELGFAVGYGEHKMSEDAIENDDFFSRDFSGDWWLDSKT